MVVSQHHDIIFNLEYNSVLLHYIPVAYVANSSINTPQFLLKTVNTNTLKSFGIELDASLIKAIDCCNNFKIETIQSKYKSLKNIELVLKTDDGKKIIFQYLSIHLNRFYELVVKHQLFLSYNLDRATLFKTKQINFSDNSLLPMLKFQKSDNDYIYTLNLVNNGERIIPSSTALQILLNDPAWIIMNHQLFKLDVLNANKVIPFLKKQEVLIPEKTSRQYFKTFIKDILNKVEIETEGFDIQYISDFQEVVISSVYDFLLDQYLIQLTFHYNGFAFSYQNKKSLHSKLTIEPEIEVKQIKRNFVREQEFVDQLHDLGLSVQKDGLFAFESHKKSNSKYSTLEFILQNKTNFTQAGFEIEPFQIDGKKIVTEFGILKSQVNEKPDWFDINIQVTCGKFTFPFITIVPLLKKNQSLFELTDGTFFLIPSEWFSKYKSIIEFGSISDKGIQLKKNQAPLLEGLPNYEKYSAQPEIIDYHPPKTLKATLRPYQTEGVKWLISHFQNGLGACLADDMGLGKTLQTLAVLLYAKEQLQEQPYEVSLDLFTSVLQQSTPLKALVVVPSSLVFNWKSESKKFAPSLTSIVFQGKERHKIKSKLQLYDIVFTSYSIALKDVEVLKTHHFNYLILDESQYLKNKNAKLFSAINSLSIPHKISLSGTPIENSLSDLWAQMQCINPDLLGSFAFFKSHFKDPIEKFQDETAILELKKLTNPYLLRRTKNEVAKDLPPVLEQLFLSEMDANQQNWYEAEKSKVRNVLLNNAEKPTKINVLNQLMKLRQMANHPSLVDANSSMNSGKFEDVVAYLETLVKAKHKTLIFSSFVKHLEIYTQWCKQQNIPYAILTGETPSENRATIVNNFQEQTEPLLFFISLKAGGVGLNLTVASYVLLLDPWWNPFAENQAIARAHRIGQQKNVTVVRFIAKDSIEEKIIALQDKKKALSDAIIDNASIPEEIENELEFILE